MTVALRATAFTWPDRVVGIDDPGEVGVLGPDERAVRAGLGIDEIRADDELSATALAASARPSMTRTPRPCAGPAAPRSIWRGWD